MLTIKVHQKFIFSRISLKIIYCVFHIHVQLVRQWKCNSQLVQRTLPSLVEHHIKKNQISIKQRGSSTTKTQQKWLVAVAFVYFYSFKKIPAAVFWLSSFFKFCTRPVHFTPLLTHLFTARQEKTISFFTFYTTGGAGSWVLLLPVCCWVKVKKRWSLTHHVSSPAACERGINSCCRKAGWCCSPHSKACCVHLPFVKIRIPNQLKSNEAIYLMFPKSLLSTLHWKTLVRTFSIIWYKCYIFICRQSQLRSDW